MPTRRGTPANQLGSAGAAARAWNYLRNNATSAANRRAANRGYRGAMRTILGGSGSGGSGSTGG